MTGESGMVQTYNNTVDQYWLENITPEQWEALRKRDASQCAERQRRKAQAATIRQERIDRDITPEAFSDGQLSPSRPRRSRRGGSRT
jgi:hypothetical protein